MSLVLLIVAAVLFLLAALTDGVAGGTPLDLVAVGLFCVAVALALGALPVWPRRD